MKSGVAETVEGAINGARGRFDGAEIARCAVTYRPNPYGCDPILWHEGWSRHSARYAALAAAPLASCHVLGSHPTPIAAPLLTFGISRETMLQ